MKLSLGFAAALLIGASTAVPALQSRQDACYTVHSGYFVVHPYSTFDRVLIKSSISGG